MSYTSAEDAAFLSGTPRHEHRKTTRKMRWWYESLADFMMANPRCTQNEIAQHFGRAVSTISTIINTDAFKAYMRQRRSEHAEQLDASVRAKLMNVADKGLELILDQLDKKRDTIPIQQLQNTVDSTLKSLGYGATAPGPQVVVNNNQTPQVIPVAVSMADLEVARQALRQSQAQILPAPPLTIDHVPSEEPAE